MKKLNIGSGEFLKEGFVNVDYYSVTVPDVKHDLSKFPYPFQENEFDLVESDHCLEHLADPVNLTNYRKRIRKMFKTMI